LSAPSAPSGISILASGILRLYAPPAAGVHTLTQFNIIQAAGRLKAPFLPVRVSPKPRNSLLSRRSISHLSVPPHFFAKNLICQPPVSTLPVPAARQSAAPCRQAAARPFSPAVAANSSATCSRSSSATPAAGDSPSYGEHGQPLAHLVGPIEVAAQPRHLHRAQRAPLAFFDPLLHRPRLLCLRHHPPRRLPTRGLVQAARRRDRRRADGDGCAPAVQPSRQDLVRRGRRLEYFTIGYNGAEGLGSNPALRPCQRRHYDHGSSGDDDSGMIRRECYAASARKQPPTIRNVIRSTCSRRDRLRSW